LGLPGSVRLTRPAKPYFPAFLAHAVAAFKPALCLLI